MIKVHTFTSKVFNGQKQITNDSHMKRSLLPSIMVMKTKYPIKSLLEEHSYPLATH